MPLRQEVPVRSRPRIAPHQYGDKSLIQDERLPRLREERVLLLRVALQLHPRAGGVREREIKMESNILKPPMGGEGGGGEGGVEAAGTAGSVSGIDLIFIL